MTNKFSIPRASALWRSSRRKVGMAAAGLMLVACSTHDLLDVNLDVITPESAQSASGALALRAAAIRDFSVYFSSNVSSWSFQGGVTDELITARPGFETFDQRLLTEGVTTNPWGQFSATHYSTPVALRSMRQYLPDDATRKNYIGHVQSLFGFSLIMAGETFCNGVPLSEKKADGSLYYDPHMYTNSELWDMAIVYFDSALNQAFTATDAMRSLARIGKARALLDQGKYVQAAAVVAAGGDGAGSAAVPTAYVYNVDYSTTSLSNGIADWLPNSGNFGTPKTPKGINGLDWNADPRIGVGATPLRVGQDGTTPVYMPTAVAWAKTTNDPVPLATGKEARLMEAEADLSTGGTNWLTIINTLRSGQTTFALPAYTDPGTPAARLDLIMKERAMWMYLTSHRMGDLRRLIRQYGRTQDKVFPTGAYFKGGVYGTDVNVPPSAGEHNNPAYEAAGGKCIDRNA